NPFWEDFPYTNIHASVTPDVLHQIYQGVIKHILGWCTTLLTEKEFDARVRALPPAFGVRHFQNGFSVLSQISGPERKEMTKILLGCLVGKIDNNILIPIRAILDFTYLAQYKAHDADTLGYMETALKTFHRYKKYIIQVKLHPTLDIPKFHSLLHYINAIKDYGTTDNYNTETFERFHIDYAKEGYRASNKRDIFPQMTAWLSRREKISMFDNYLHFLDQDHPLSPSSSTEKPATSTITIAKWPPHPRCPIKTIQDIHSAPHFSEDLKNFLNSFLSHPTSNFRAQLFDLPFERVDVWTQFKLVIPNLQLDIGVDRLLEPDKGTVKALPRSATNPSGRFDTVVVFWGDSAQSTGTDGVFFFKATYLQSNLVV
ncbi:hypothetical protein CPB83DRAFT_757482, partial [Crepidotus variabilis]